MIYYTVPYDSNKNIGEYYNNFVDIVPNDNDYICFIDADTIFTIPNYGHVIESAIKSYPDVDCFTCYTNRVNCKWQVPDGCDISTDDYKYHLFFDINEYLLFNRFQSPLPKGRGLLSNFY